MMIRKKQLKIKHSLNIAHTSHFVAIFFCLLNFVSVVFFVCTSQLTKVLYYIFIRSYLGVR